MSILGAILNATTNVGWGQESLKTYKKTKEALEKTKSQKPDKKKQK